MNFAKANYAEIMQEIIEACDELRFLTTTKEGEVLWEQVDFMPDESRAGLAPVSVGI